MGYSGPISLENTDMFYVDSYGNGAAYEIGVKDVPGFRSAFIQGDDATEWRERYEDMGNSSMDENSVWYGKTWNECLAELILDYVPEKD